jgi:hypothetical protein
MLKPRHDPTWDANGKEKFIGYAGDLDIYFEHGADDPVLVVRSREVRHGYSHHNFDQYGFNNGVLEVVGPPDVRVELHELCEIYQLLEHHGHLEESK